MDKHPRRPLDLSIYLVTDTVMCGRFGVAATVSAAVGAGVSLVQLRDEDATDDELVSLGRQVMAVLQGTGVPLIVNDRVHLVEAIGAQGGHVGQSDLGIGRARALLGPTAYLGLSVQTVDRSRPPANMETGHWTTSAWDRSGRRRPSSTQRRRGAWNVSARSGP
jgi:thiamine-phosphate pyrophosphorylase